MRTLSVLLVALTVVVVSAKDVPVDDEAALVLGQRSSPFINWCGVPCAPSGYRPSSVGIAACLNCCKGTCTQDSRQKWFCKC